MASVVRKFQPFKLPMIQYSWSILLHLITRWVFKVAAQTLSPDDIPSQVGGNFQPSLAVVIGILCIMFSLTFIILIYAKFCHRRVPVRFNLQNQVQGLIGTSSRFSGIDKTVIESLPFFKFSSLKGSKQGLECAVCLSKFEDIEILRMLPKCKHAFHIYCIDHWLEKHSSCPLCRHKISVDDLKIIASYSNSMRLLLHSDNNNNNQFGLIREDQPNCNLELFVQREEGYNKGSSSSRFSIGSCSFRKNIDHQKGCFNNDQELLIQEESEDFHKHNHRIIVSDFVFNNRWSSVSCSDLVFLNSEMLLDMSSNRFINSLDFNKDHQFVTTRSSIDNEASSSSNKTTSSTSRFVNFDDQRRSKSEIIGFSRNENLGLMMKNRLNEASLQENEIVKEERIRRLWLPIARRTLQWFANREKRSEMESSISKDKLDV